MGGRRVVVVAAVLAACSARRGDDCAVVRSDRAHALAEMTRRYPDDAVTRALVIERCVAPGGDDCERLARIIEAIPAMAPDLAAAAAAAGSAAGATLADLRAQRSLDEPGAPRARGDVRAMCRDMPAEMRRCMLPSYLLGHDGECRALRAKLAQAATDLETTRQRSHGRCDASEVVLYVTAGGAWLATGADARCFAPRQRGALDIAWLEAELRPLAAIDCPPAVELAAAPGVRYQDLVAAMDAAVKVGLLDTGLSARRELAVSFATADTHRAARHCPATTVARAAAKPSPGDAAPGRHRLGPPADKAALADAPVVLVTLDELSLGGKPGFQRIGAVAELARGSGPIAKLRQALPPHPQDPTIILQADQSTDMAVITRVVETTQAAGYSNLLFAVKTK